MADSYARFHERVVRQPLPLCCRKRFHQFIFVVYLCVQTFTCMLCAKCRRTFTRYNVVPVDPSEIQVINLTSFNDQAMVSNYSTSSTNLTLSFFSDPNTINNLTHMAMSVANQNRVNDSFTNLTMSLNNTILHSVSNMTSSNATKIIIEEGSTLYAHASLVLFFQLGLHICFFVFRLKHQILFRIAVSYLNWIVVEDVNEFRQIRNNYVVKRRKLSNDDSKTLRKVLTLKERGNLYRIWNTTCVYWNPRMQQLTSLTYPTIDCTLKDYMYSKLSNDSKYQILGAIEILHEVMKGLDYFHYRNNYHLNLMPESVKLQCNGRKVYVKLTNFKYIKKAVDKKVPSSSVGLKGFYRPLECSVDQEVDAEKCDTWGLGMIALDLFTGGMFWIKTKTAGWDVRESEEYIRDFIQHRPFFGYVQAAYRVIEMFEDARYNADLKFWGEFKSLRYHVKMDSYFKTYKVNPVSFLYDIRCFVYRLLIFNPRRRISLERAFKEPLMANRLVEKRKVVLQTV